MKNFINLLFSWGFLPLALLAYKNALEFIYVLKKWPVTTAMYMYVRYANDLDIDWIDTSKEYRNRCMNE
jgi:hypothetical protein